MPLWVRRSSEGSKTWRCRKDRRLETAGAYVSGVWVFVVIYIPLIDNGPNEGSLPVPAGGGGGVEGGGIFKKGEPGCCRGEGAFEEGNQLHLHLHHSSPPELLPGNSKCNWVTHSNKLIPACSSPLIMLATALMLPKNSKPLCAKNTFHDHRMPAIRQGSVKSDIFMKHLFTASGPDTRDRALGRRPHCTGMPSSHGPWLRGSAGTQGCSLIDGALQA